MTQNKVEVNWGKLNVKAYTTEEDAGDSYDTNAAGLLMFIAQPDELGLLPGMEGSLHNEDSFAGVKNYFGQYVGAFLGKLSDDNPSLFTTILASAAQDALSDINGDGKINIFDYI